MASPPIRPVQAESPLPMTLVTSFDQRSPQMFSVTKALSALARSPQTSLARSVTRPCTSPTRNTVWRDPDLPAARRICPGACSSTVIELATEPSVLPHPTTPAIVSSFLQFRRGPHYPSGGRD